MFLYSHCDYIVIISGETMNAREKRKKRREDVKKSRARFKAAGYVYTYIRIPERDREKLKKYTHRLCAQWAKENEEG